MVLVIGSFAINIVLFQVNWMPEILACNLINVKEDFEMKIRVEFRKTLKKNGVKGLVSGMQICSSVSSRSVAFSMVENGIPLGEQVETIRFICWTLWLPDVMKLSRHIKIFNCNISTFSTSFAPGCEPHAQEKERNLKPLGII